MDTPQFPQGARVLRLSLKKQWFDLMVTGEKNLEVRKPSQWMMSRLEGREPMPEGLYDFVLFTNGYGRTKPWFSCRYEGWCKADCHHRRHYGGHVVAVERGDIKIFLGPVLQSGNLKPSPQPA